MPSPKDCSNHVKNIAVAMKPRQCFIAKRHVGIAGFSLLNEFFHFFLQRLFYHWPSYQFIRLQAAKIPLNFFLYFVDIANNGNYHVVWDIMRAIVVGYVIPVEALYSSYSAVSGVPGRMLIKQGFLEQDPLVQPWVVSDHVNFLQNHLLFLLYNFIVKYRIGNHVRKNVKCNIKSFIYYFYKEACPIACCISVKLAPVLFDFICNFSRVFPVFRALKQHVLQEMRQSKRLFALKIGAEPEHDFNSN